MNNQTETKANTVYIVVSGKDISQSMRPLIHSFFGNITYEYHYAEEFSDAPAEGFDISCIMNFGDTFMTISVYEGGTRTRYRESRSVPKDIREYRYMAGRFVYECLNAITGKELPWGILVGIRPTKLVYEGLEKGMEEQEIKDRFMNELYVSERRTDIAMSIARREREILSGFDYEKGYSLYIGIPFCPTTCLYCSFTSYPVEKFGRYMDAYLKALEKEMEYARSAIKDKTLNTIYIGGGTPTALDEENLEKLLQAVHRYFPVESVLEFCVEAGRPDSLSVKKLELLKQYGVNRISINPQSLVPRTLELIGRKHSVEAVYKAFEMARACGHDNINMDLIVGLTGETPEDVAETLKGVEILRPESLTVHTLALKRAARLKIENDKYRGMEATGIGQMLEMTLDFTEKHGLRPYYLYRQKNMAENLENTGYSLPGRECLYNILIMEEKQTILALGAGATTKYVYNAERLDRIENVKSLTDYIDRIDEMIERKKAFLAECYGTE
ncbi:MAG: coproporphyrinogen dehydrogenase HemZ [Lachnospiraceae bacterium]